MADVFLSYASEDRERIIPLVDALHARKFTVWWDRDIGIGASYDRVIERQLNDALCVIVVWSKRAIESDWVKNEAQEGYNRGVLVPVRIDAVQPPLAFRRLQTADLTDDASPAGMTGMLATVRSLTGRAEASGAVETPDAAVQPGPVGRRRAAFGMLAAIVVVSVALAGWYLWPRSSIPPPEAGAVPSVAMLPLNSADESPAMLRVTAAVGTDIRTALADTGIRFVEAPVASDPSPDFVLTGSVRQKGVGILVSLELKRSADQRVVWADRLQQDSIDVAAPVYLRARVVALMVERMAFVANYRRQMLASNTLDPRVVNAYFDGLTEVNRIDLQLGGNWRVAVGHFERAIEIDPSQEAAYYRLLLAYAGRLGDTIPWSEASPKAHDYLRRFQAIVPNDRFWPGTVHLFIDLNLDAAEADLDAVGPAPGVAAVRCSLAFGKGRIRAAVQLCEAAAAERQEPQALRQLGWMLIYAGRYQDAREVLTRALNAGGDGGDMVTRVLKAYAEIHDGDLSAGAETLDRAWALYGDDDPSLFISPYAMLGRTDEARRILAETLRREEAGTRQLVGVSSIFAGLYQLGELDMAADFLKRGIENREIAIVGMIRCNPDLKGVWTDPRFSDALARLEEIERGSEEPSTAADEE